MDQWAFVAAAYAVTLIGTGLVSVISWRTMRAAEGRAEHFPDRG